MVRITRELLRQRAEHNEGTLADLRQLRLHQQNIEIIEVIGHACRQLRTLYLTNNLISSLRGLEHLKELIYLNVALNNLTSINHLQGCESLQKLDLSVNFVAADRLSSVTTLQHNTGLREMHLLGNPCAAWSHHRQYVAAVLPQLESLDGRCISQVERTSAQHALPQLMEQLKASIDDASAAHGVGDLPAAAADHGSSDGQARMPWSPATRLQEHKEAAAISSAADAAKVAGGFSWDKPASVRRRTGFDPINAADGTRQTNEGKWPFAFSESADGRQLILAVKCSHHVASDDIVVDLHPTMIRMLIKGKLLQLTLPDEVLPATSQAQRSLATGQLQLTVTKVPCMKARLAAHTMPADAGPDSIGASISIAGAEQDGGCCFPALSADSNSQS